MIKAKKGTALPNRQNCAGIIWSISEFSAPGPERDAATEARLAEISASPVVAQWSEDDGWRGLIYRLREIKPVMLALAQRLTQLV